MPAADNVRETDVTVPMRDGGEITIRTYQPTETKSAAPVLVMLHGGGFILGGLENEAPLCRKWVEEFGGVSFNVDYRLAPEHKFPTAVHDAYDALVWVSTYLPPHSVLLGESKDLMSICRYKSTPSPTTATSPPASSSRVSQQVPTSPPRPRTRTAMTTNNHR